MATVLPLVADALAVANSALQTLSIVMPIITNAQAEGRVTLTADEWATIKGDADAADTQFDTDLNKGS